MTGGCVFMGVCLFNFQRGEGYPHPPMGGGVVPHQVLMGMGVTPMLPDGGYPILPDRGDPPPPPSEDWMGIPPPPLGVDGVPPCQKIWWVPPPHQETGWGYVPPLGDWMGYTLSPPPQEIEQQSEHLLPCKRYASCVHAGGLSCFIPKFKLNWVLVVCCTTTLAFKHLRMRLWYFNCDIIYCNFCGFCGS